MVEALAQEDVINIVMEAGYTKPLANVSLSEKGSLLSIVLTYHLFIKSKAMMDQFREGLEQSGVLSFLKKYEDQMRPLFVNERTALTAGKCSVSGSYQSAV